MKQLRLQAMCEDQEEVKNLEKEFLRFKRRLKHNLGKKTSYEAIILNKKTNKYKIIVSIG